MHTLTGAELLSVWDRGRLQPPVQRALTLLAAACPETPPDSLAELPIGARDGRLLALREGTFGPRLAALARCPACGQRLDLTFAVADVRAPGPPSDGELRLTAAGHDLCFRLPTSRDLLAAAGSDGVPAVRQRLLERCLIEARQGGAARTADGLPPQVVTAVVEHMARADPQADVRLAVTCPACGQAWEEAFDIVSYFWAEIDAWALRLLRDVHTLASAYGWREADILALSAWRRQCYLEMVRG
jgi:hypothetical protein